MHAGYFLYLLPVFQIDGYRDWKHATGKNGSLKKHSKSISHKQAMVAWSDYVKNTNERATIAERLDKLRSTQIKRTGIIFHLSLSLFYFLQDKMYH